MEVHGEDTTKYTICFDLFSESDIFEPDTSISEVYLETLVQKNIAQPSTTFRKSSWIDKVWESKNIFYPKENLGKAKKISLSKWSDKIESAKLKLKRQASTQVKSIDYRFTAIEITPIEPTQLAMSAAQSMNQLLPSEGATNSYITDKLCAELLGFGVVRLYKDSENHINLFKIDSPGLKHVPGDNTTLAILAVPFYFSASDLLLGFFDEDDAKQISHIRLIKSSSPNRFMILLKFRATEAIKPFLRKYQGRKFNSFEPETCSVVEVKEIVFRPKTKNEGEHIRVALPYLLEDPFTNGSSEIPKNKDGNGIYTELATCPVCLDRLDSSVTGLFTIPCQHTFHSSCLSKWKDDTCPVCRYSNRINKTTADLSSLSLLDSASTSIPDNNEKCMVCGLTEHLWICLICGNVGCGRYDQQHAIHHWEETGHCFSMETNTQRVWDYAEDGYVHRLVQNEADGKIVELPLRDESKKSSDEKIEKIGFEYSKMLIGQLESQREHYEKIIAGLSSDLVFQKQTSLRFNDKVNLMEKQIREINEKMNTKTKDFQNFEKVKQQLGTLKKELADANVLNEVFSAKIEVIENQNAELKKEKCELQEQVTDLMFYLESQEKFKNASDDVKEGQVIMVPKKSSRSKSKSKKH